MTAKALGLSVPLYDADANQRKVRDKFIGTDVRPSSDCSVEHDGAGLIPPFS